MAGNTELQNTVERNLPAGPSIEVFWKNLPAISRQLKSGSLSGLNRDLFRQGPGYYEAQLPGGKKTLVTNTELQPVARFIRDFYQVGTDPRGKKDLVITPELARDSATTALVLGQYYPGAIEDAKFYQTRAYLNNPVAAKLPLDKNPKVPKFLACIPVEGTQEHIRFPQESELLQYPDLIKSPVSKLLIDSLSVVEAYFSAQLAQLQNRYGTGVLLRGIAYDLGFFDSERVALTRSLFIKYPDQLSRSFPLIFSLCTLQGSIDNEDPTANATPFPLKADRINHEWIYRNSGNANVVLAKLQDSFKLDDEKAAAKAENLIQAEANLQAVRPVIDQFKVAYKRTQLPNEAGKAMAASEHPYKEQLTVLDRQLKSEQTLQARFSRAERALPFQRSTMRAAKMSNNAIMMAASSDTYEQTAKLVENSPDRIRQLEFEIKGGVRKLVGTINHGIPRDEELGEIFLDDLKTLNVLRGLSPFMNVSRDWRRIRVLIETKLEYFSGGIDLTKFAICNPELDTLGTNGDSLHTRRLICIATALDELVGEGMKSQGHKHDRPYFLEAALTALKDPEFYEKLPELNLTATIKEPQPVNTGADVQVLMEQCRAVINTGFELFPGDKVPPIGSFLQAVEDLPAVSAALAADTGEITKPGAQYKGEVQKGIFAAKLDTLGGEIVPPQVIISGETLAADANAIPVLRALAAVIHLDTAHHGRQSGELLAGFLDTIADSPNSVELATLLSTVDLSEDSLRHLKDREMKINDLDSILESGIYVPGNKGGTLAPGKTARLLSGLIKLGDSRFVGDEQWSKACAMIKQDPQLMRDGLQLPDSKLFDPALSRFNNVTELSKLRLINIARELDTRTGGGNNFFLRSVIDLFDQQQENMGRFSSLVTPQMETVVVRNFGPKPVTKESSYLIRRIKKEWAIFKKTHVTALEWTAMIGAGTLIGVLVGGAGGVIADKLAPDRPRLFDLSKILNIESDPATPEVANELQPSETPSPTEAPTSDLSTPVSTAIPNLTPIPEGTSESNSATVGNQPGETPAPAGIDVQNNISVSGPVQAESQNQAHSSSKSDYNGVAGAQEAIAFGKIKPGPNIGYSLGVGLSVPSSELVSESAPFPVYQVAGETDYANLVAQYDQDPNAVVIEDIRTLGGKFFILEPGQSLERVIGDGEQDLTVTRKDPWGMVYEFDGKFPRAIVIINSNGPTDPSSEAQYSIDPSQLSRDTNPQFKKLMDSLTAGANKQGLAQTVDGQILTFVSDYSATIAALPPGDTTQQALATRNFLVKIWSLTKAPDEFYYNFLLDYQAGSDPWGEQGILHMVLDEGQTGLDCSQSTDFMVELTRTMGIRSMVRSTKPDTSLSDTEYKTRVGHAYPIFILPDGSLIKLDATPLVSDKTDKLFLLALTDPEAYYRELLAASGGSKEEQADLAKVLSDFINPNLEIIEGLTGSTFVLLMLLLNRKNLLKGSAKVMEWINSRQNAIVATKEEGFGQAFIPTEMHPRIKLNLAQPQPLPEVALDQLEELPEAVVPEDEPLADEDVFTMLLRGGEELDVYGAPYLKKISKIYSTFVNRNELTNLLERINDAPLDQQIRLLQSIFFNIEQILRHNNHPIEADLNRGFPVTGDLKFAIRDPLELTVLIGMIEIVNGKKIAELSRYDDLLFSNSATRLAASAVQV